MSSRSVVTKGGRIFTSLCALALALAAWPSVPATVRAHGGHGGGGGRPRWRVLAPVTYKNLTLFPVAADGLGPAPSDNNYITLDEGLRGGTVVVAERGAGRVVRTRRGVRRRVSDDATVNQLVLINRSGKKLLLLAGEVVVGGKQDRIVEEDLIVPAISVPVSLNVFCVEPGRWNARGGGGEQAHHGGRPVAAAPAPIQNFSTLGAISHPKLRAAAQHSKDQDEVWKEVRSNNAKLGTTNSTETYQEVYANREVESRVEDYVAELRKAGAAANVVGVVVARNGEFVWVDAFASRALFARYWPKLLKSYVIDAIGDRASERVPGVAQAEQYLRESGGAATASGREGVYRLTKTTHEQYAVFRLEDLSLPAPLQLHFNKMQKQ
ncbi:MAG TPA: DUF6569 family protein [Pyrinomonadaceae bacterium]|nr:DUF6569 family protein [Pyrinomonadaceae bacterium]